MSMVLKSRSSALGAAAGAGALLFTVACGAAPRDLNVAAAQPLAASQTGAPVLVSCEPHQRALVRPVVVNGAAVSQVECVAAGQPAAYAANQLAAPVPVSYGAPAYAPAAAPRPVYGQLGDAQVVPPTAAPTPAPTPADEPMMIALFLTERPRCTGRSS